MAADTSFLQRTNADINSQLLTAQQQLALAQALRGQAVQPLQPPPGQNGRISPLSVLSQALMGYTSGKMMDSATHDLATAQASQAHNQMDMMQLIARQLSGQAPGQPQPGAGSQDASPPPPAQAAGAAPQSTGGAPAQQGSGLPLTGIQAEMYGFPEAAKFAYDQASLTPEQKNARDALIGDSVRGNLATQNMTDIQRLQRARALLPPGDPRITEIDNQIGKLNYVTPAEIKQGNVALDKDNKAIFYNPKTADGVVPMFQTVGGVTTPIGARALPGYAGANAGIQGAEQGAKQANTIFTGVPGPDGKPISDWGGKVAGTVGADPTNQTARTNQQNDLAAKWKPLNEAMSNAQTINSRLDTIKDLATRAATGQFADRMQFVNSLLSMAGSEKATDANTAKVLLDKNANQIVAQLGQGGLATDAARAIIGAAYPNSHMPREAISEAADNLKAANSMQVAKGKILQPHYLNNDPASYQRAETQFSAMADPRIFQWHAMPKGPAKDAFAAKLIQQDPSMPAKVKGLEDMGAFQ